MCALRSIASFKQEAGRALAELQAQLVELGSDEVHTPLQGTAGAAGCGPLFMQTSSVMRSAPTHLSDCRKHVPHSCTIKFLRCVCTSCFLPEPSA